MNRRAIYLDASPGETRGVVTLDGLPERLLIRRDEDDPRLQFGARLVARVAAVEPSLMMAFLDLGGSEAILRYRPEARLAVGRSIEIEIRSEPTRGKLAVARMIGEAAGSPRLVQGPPDIEWRLRTLVRDTELVTGAMARAAADEAEAVALEIVHALPAGGSIAIEVTRALIAVDVDLGERKGVDAKRVTRAANLAAIAAAARLLRLKGLGGLVVIDLAGRGHDGAALLAAARGAFAPDNPGVSLGPVSRFGVMELSLPRHVRPLHEILQRPDGVLTDRSLVQRLVRRMQHEGEIHRGARLVAHCNPELAKASEPFVAALGTVLGNRFEVRSDPTLLPGAIEVIAQ